MPMNSTQDFAMSDISKDYCTHCARPDGSMQSYDEKLESMTGFIIKTQGFDLKAARETARSTMSRLPAWSGR